MLDFYSLSMSFQGFAPFFGEFEKIVCWLSIVFPGFCFCFLGE